jgi:hypothetical protein
MSGRYNPTSHRRRSYGPPQPKRGTSQRKDNYWFQDGRRGLKLVIAYSEGFRTLIGCAQALFIAISIAGPTPPGFGALGAYYARA